MECMFCKRTLDNAFNLYTTYGLGPNTIRDDLVEFFGTELEPFLDMAEDHLCNICMNMVESLTKLKRVLSAIILTPREMRYSKKVGRFWDFFKKFPFDESYFYSDEFDRSETPLSYKSRSSTPNLLIPMYSREYDEKNENKVNYRNFCRAEKYRSVSRSSGKASSCGEQTDQEITDIFSTSDKMRKHRKRRGHGWTRQKRSGSVVSSSSRRSIPRPPRRSTHSTRSSMYSPVSECSYMSYSRPKKDWKHRPPTLIYDETTKELVNRRTRAVSRMEEEEIEKQEEEKKGIFYCRFPGCKIYLKELELFNEHMKNDHKCLALYECHFCLIKFTTEEHLNLHMKTHETTYFYCSRCMEQFYSHAYLHAHEEDPTQHRAQCRYCDMAFAQKSTLLQHIETAHPRKHRRTRKRPEHVIREVLEDFDKVISEREQHARERVKLDFKDFHTKDFVSEIHPISITPRIDPFETVKLPERWGSHIDILAFAIARPENKVQIINNHTKELHRSTEEISFDCEPASSKTLTVPLERLECFQRQLLSDKDLASERTLQDIVKETSCVITNETGVDRSNEQDFPEVIHTEIDLGIVDESVDTDSITSEVSQESFVDTQAVQNTQSKEQDSLTNEEVFENREAVIDEFNDPQTERDQSIEEAPNISEESMKNVVIYEDFSTIPEHEVASVQGASSEEPNEDIFDNCVEDPLYIEKDIPPESLLEKPRKKKKKRERDTDKPYETRHVTGDFPNVHLDNKLSRNMSSEAILNIIQSDLKLGAEERMEEKIRQSVGESVKTKKRGLKKEEVSLNERQTESPENNVDQTNKEPESDSIKTKKRRTNKAANHINNFVKTKRKTRAFHINDFLKIQTDVDSQSSQDSITQNTDSVVISINTDHFDINSIGEIDSPSGESISTASLQDNVSEDDTQHLVVESPEDRTSTSTTRTRRKNRVDPTNEEVDLDSTWDRTGGTQDRVPSSSSRLEELSVVGKNVQGKEVSITHKTRRKKTRTFTSEEVFLDHIHNEINLGAQEHVQDSPIEERKSSTSGSGKIRKKRRDSPFF